MTFRSKSGGEIAGMIVGLVVVVVALALLGAVITKAAWNHGLVNAVPVHKISFVTALWLNVLGSMLFRGWNLNSSKED